MKNRSGEKIKLASIDELLGVVNEESAMEIEISKIHPFKNHPFKVLDDEKMQDLVESVKINGVLTPVLLRMDENEDYEMVSGHRRMHAAQLAGLTTIPAIVRELSDDDAIVAMVDANIQREELLPSEKAFAYKMKLDAMKRQGSRTDITSGQIDQKLKPVISRNILADQVGESSKGKECLPAELHGNQKFRTTWGRLKWDEVSPTIDTRFDASSNGTNNHPFLHRAITPREAARIQSFDDKFVFEGSKVYIRKQIGNAVPPLLAKAIADQIAEGFGLEE